jgi:hypothetical protein
MCVECGDDERMPRRTFLSGVTAALAGVVISSEAAGQQSPFRQVLDDPTIFKETVTYKSGTASRAISRDPGRRVVTPLSSSPTATPEFRKILNIRRHI